MERIKSKLHERGYDGVWILQPAEAYKDWNEMRQDECGKLKAAPVQKSAEEETGGMVMQ